MAISSSCSQLTLDSLLNARLATQIHGIEKLENRQRV